MLVIFGHRAKVLPGKMLTQSTCEDCGQGTLRTFSVWQYAHVFWIPLFPFRRQMAAECTHCRATRIGKEIQSSVQQSIKREHAAKKAPVYMFSGLFAFVAFFAAMGVRGHLDDRAMAEYFAEPKVNDVYVVELSEILDMTDEDYHYGVLKLTDVRPDSVRFLVGTYGYRYATDASRAVRDGDIMNEGYFYEGNVVLSHGDMQSLYDEEFVKRILRE